MCASLETYDSLETQFGLITPLWVCVRKTVPAGIKETFSVYRPMFINILILLSVFDRLIFTFDGTSASGKPSVFGADIHRFESYRPKIYLKIYSLSKKD